MAAHQDYPFDPETEGRRLRAQTSVFDPMTARLFTEAGIAPGMRVLDLGSGSGNVAMLAAEFVGAKGSVVGVERDPAELAIARSWARWEERPNIEYVEGDVMTLDGVEGEFDAVVGRTILTHLAEPDVALRAATARLRANGLLCMHELDLTYSWAQPETPLWRQIRGWILDTFAASGVDDRMGMSLFSLYRALGLPDARLRIEATAGAGRRSVAFAYAETVAGLIPVMERLGIATADEVSVRDLEGRLDAELDAHDGFAVSPVMIGAWTRVPASRS